MSGRVYISPVWTLTAAEYGQIRQMNLRGSGSMQWRLAAARKGEAAGEVALWVDKGIIRSVCLWTGGMVGYSHPDGTIDLYTPVRERHQGHGLTLLGETLARHRDAVLFGWARQHATMARKRHADQRRAKKLARGYAGRGWQR